jgi:hypothetical protein
MTTIQTQSKAGKRRLSPKQQAFLFFYKHAGFSFDPAKETKRQGRAKCAKELAKAEREARALGYRFEWIDDFSANHEKEFGYSVRTCETCFCYVSDGSDDDNWTIAESLSCIDDATDEYRRVVEAVLAQEALGEMEVEK